MGERGGARGLCRDERKERAGRRGGASFELSPCAGRFQRRMCRSRGCSATGTLVPRSCTLSRTCQVLPHGHASLTRISLTRRPSTRSRASCTSGIRPLSRPTARKRRRARPCRPSASAARRAQQAESAAELQQGALVPPTPLSLSLFFLSRCRPFVSVRHPVVSLCRPPPCIAYASLSLAYSPTPSTLRASHSLSTVSTPTPSARTSTTNPTSITPLAPCSRAARSSLRSASRFSLSRSSASGGPAPPPRTASETAAEPATSPTVSLMGRLPHGSSEVCERGSCGGCGGGKDMLRASGIAFQGGLRGGSALSGGFSCRSRRNDALTCFA